MANKRSIKRGINYICSELFAECVALSLYNARSAKEDVDSLLKSILRTHSDYIKRVSHPEPGMKAKVYYKILIENFNKDVNDLADQIRNQH